MAALDPWWFVAGFILLAYTIEAITGFGSIVIALSLGALLLPLETLLPVMVPLNICMTGYLAIRHRRHIHWPTLLKVILPLMGLGTLAGYVLKPWLGDQVMRLLFASLVIWFAGREVWKIKRGITPSRHSSLWNRFWTACAGLSHGLFASGGPLLVYALSGTELRKEAFRATLISVWFTLNSLLTVLYLFDGSLAASLPKIALFLPLIVLGIVIGEQLHHRINETQFRFAVFLLLFFTGVILLTGSLKALSLTL